MSNFRSNDVWAVHPRIVTAIRKLGLTQREEEVVTIMMAGHPSREVAEFLNITPATVRTHLRSVYGKCQVNGRPGMMSKIMHEVIYQLEVEWLSTSSSLVPKSAEDDLARYYLPPSTFEKRPMGQFNTCHVGRPEGIAEKGSPDRRFL